MIVTRHQHIELNSVECLQSSLSRRRWRKNFWRQKEAIRWAVDGERNSKFFHGWVRQKRVKSRIHTVEFGGQALTEETEIRESVATYFQQLLTSDVGDLAESDLSLIQTLPDSVDQDALCAPPQEKEVRDAVFGTSGDSVPGPDRFTSSFFQHRWDTVGRDVIAVVADFFSGAFMPQSFTSTMIVLIPKKPNPVTWGDYRPISLCNVTSKIITKIIASRLAPLLPLVIAPNQSGFIKGRLLSDNALLAQELIHDLGKELSSRGRSPNLALKLDMAKAYDRVQWSFLLKVLETMGFSTAWKVNNGNTHFFLATEHMEFASIVEEVGGFQRGVLPFTYLGVPIFRGAMKADHLLPLRQKLMDIIHSWSHRHLAFGSRLALIKSTLAAIPLHILQVMNPLLGFLDELEQTLARYFWGTVGEKRKLHWISWRQICLPFDEGGLGIRHLREVSVAFGFKLWWRLLAQDSLWAKFMN
ncbi:uncharacterized protein LOC121743412 [Salvia splendens]|uniref:uncharacterized protein LOC121743412 n=1 Tax=Salvia splendens TaxID=180675 RepID=UPI001C27E6B7|nr:uncharacterized protein LOC121743412 [Salvia splendens]